ncbi:MULTISPECIES: hypothetical protein [unclassified Sphingomonas]|jgi:hypothetical protein|uniref:hypothetical protein n=1 Tax=unclassified Sphingomonas TaxID=196159 RepID=UPI0025F362F1|nr:MULTISPECIES: hypothetical protein [unclassified Sphingomonas]
MRRIAETDFHCCAAVGHAGCAVGVGCAPMTLRPIGFWLYVAAGVVMIVASTLAMPFMASRTR